MSTPDEELSTLISTAAASASDEAQDSQPTKSTHRCDVLLVDDTGASRELLAAILRNFAGRLVMREARNGAEALRIWKDLNPRITLLDIDMPGEDGLFVLQEMRNQRADTFVAMISGSNSMDNVKRALALGASGFVIKPYKPQRILDLLKKYSEQAGHTFL
jgi:two-component system, chemotaxis family, chemotaxis protein CheY